MNGPLTDVRSEDGKGVRVGRDEGHGEFSLHYKRLGKSTVEDMGNFLESKRVKIQEKVNYSRLNILAGVAIPF